MKRTLIASIVLVAACGSSSKKPAAPPAPPATTEAPAPAPNPVPSGPAPSAPEVMAADTPRTTVEGATFIAPAGWTVVTRGAAVILSPPENGSWVALVDSHAKDADGAVAAAWAAYAPDAKRKVAVAVDQPGRDGWEQARAYQYEVSPNEKRVVAAVAQRAGDTWTVVIIDVAEAIGEKRGSQFGVVLGRLLPKGGARESFAGKEAHALDAEHIKMLTDFVEASRQKLDIPGVAIALVDHGKVVFEGGFGVRELGKKPAADANTKFIIASNTKALTTLMLARLVDQKKATWETPVTQLYPDFKLGDADTTKQVLLRHLVCACTGLPRQDFEWIFEFKGATPLSELAVLATVQPTSKFGEMFQYSNGLAAAAGFVGGHILFPKKELGAAYDEAMRTQVFVPLGMKDVTFDFKKALAGNHAGAHGLDVDGKTTMDNFAVNYAVVPLRPAGGLWSSVHDLVRYVQMELAKGVVDGKRYIGEEALLTRRAPQVPIGKDAVYGMGLMVDTGRGVEVVHHGGDLIGYHSDMMWLPGQEIGAVILTNSDNGPYLVGAFRRRLLEVLFDGKPEAEENIASAVTSVKAGIAAERPHLTVPADPAEVAKLGARYTNAALGTIDVVRGAKATSFDFGEWKSEVASRKNDDGTISLVLITPGVSGLPFVIGEQAGKHTLTLRDAQHEYVFTEVTK
jgi:CubicO group peptidase (beta-lactamase class C family)